MRCVVVTGSGKAFCGGGDVKDFAQDLPRIGVLLKELTTYIHGVVSRLVRTPKPVITAVNGSPVRDSASLLATLREQLRILGHPRKLVVELVQDGKTCAIDYYVM